MSGIESTMTAWPIDEQAPRLRRLIGQMLVIAERHGGAGITRDGEPVAVLVDAGSWRRLAALAERPDDGPAAAAGTGENGLGGWAIESFAAEDRGAVEAMIEAVAGNGLRLVRDGATVAVLLDPTRWREWRARDVRRIVRPGDPILDELSSELDPETEAAWPSDAELDEWAEARRRMRHG